MMKESFGKMRVTLAVFFALFGLFASGCKSDDDNTPTAPVTTVSESANATPAVLNDDPNCELQLRDGNRLITNVGQVVYVKRILICKPSGSQYPVCVQYNDTRIGEVTAWKNTANRGDKVIPLPTDRGIDKVIVWYQ